MVIEGKIIQPLTLDVSAYKRRYNSLVNLTSYERANKLGLEQKRLKWAVYRPLDKAQLYDSLDPVTTTILSPNYNGSSKRSSSRGALYSQSSVVHRPTELLAIAHALGLYTFASDDPVIRQDSGKILRWCIACKTFKTVDMFAKDKHNPSGLAFCCNRCRKDLDRGVWKAA